MRNFSKALDVGYDIPFDVKLSVSVNISDDDSKESDPVMIPCHKLVMALSSPVFAKLFFSGKVNPELPCDYDGDLVTMKDMDPDVIRMFVKFSYNKKLELSSKPLVFLVELYTTAASFEITDLQVYIFRTSVKLKSSIYICTPRSLS